MRVAVDRPEPGDEMQVGLQAGRSHSVAEIVDRRIVVVQFEIVHTPAERCERPPCGARRHGPHIAAIALQHTAENARQEHDDIGHR